MMTNLRYEWRRISSIRSTWILSCTALIVAAAIAELAAFAIGQGANNVDPSTGELQQSAFTFGEFLSVASLNPIVLVILSTIAAQAFGQEYRHGTIRLTLTAFPRRVPVFVSKILVSLATIVGVFLVSVALIALIGLVNGDAVSRDGANGDFLAPVGRAVLFLIGYCLIVFAITVLTRVLALGVIIPLLLLIVIENLLVLFLGSRISWLVDVMPFMSGIGFVGGDDMTRNGLVFLAWIAGLIGAGLVVFRTRDA